jgi:protein-S-isoprenylcysteine O-methyltransferase Ste14
MMFIEHFLLAIFWLLFSLLHSIFASEKCKRSVEVVMKKKYKYYRVLYSLFAFISLSSIVVYHISINTIMLWNVQPIEVIFSIAGIITGAFVMIFFAKKFFFELSGADVFIETKRSENLIKESLYNYVRHPLYTATLLLIWNIFFLHPSLSNLISASCITVYTIIGIHFEEKKLISNFGESYIQYRSETPMLIPNLYSVILNNNKYAKRNISKK